MAVRFDRQLGAVVNQKLPDSGYRATGSETEHQGEGMRSTDGKELDRLLDEQLAYYRALAADYLNQALVLLG